MIEEHGASLEKNGKGQLFHTDDLYVEAALTEDEIKKSEGDANKAGLTSGLYFLAKGNINLLKPVFRYLEHHGLGGDRNIGKGFFEFEIDTLDFPSIDSYEGDPNAELTLSLFHPLQFEAKTLSQYAPHSDEYRRLNYQLVWRKGKPGVVSFNRQIDKNPIIMFEEGSVFSQWQNSPQGLY